ncbi:MAG: UDP-3-O-(3-hydroxymyristoyl)glucosamine N-acyltransferase [Rhodoferax sp.]|nr:UDP-3-O-(3-hydroxymyristoyl)glucosamine N-acyltransferase [Rhodoferax sp.]
MQLTLAEIVAALGGTLIGKPSLSVQGISSLELAQAQHIAFLSNPRYQAQLQSCKAACVIISAAMQAFAPPGMALILVTDPYLYYARLTQLWRKLTNPQPPAGVHPSAVVDNQAQIHPTATIGPLCVLERGARVGANTILKARVSVGEDCQIGARCILHPGVVIGADGFGFAPNRQRWEKIEQLGAVRIGDDVEIGANTCIDRGALNDTVIEDGVKLDNLIQIGHNVRIGRNTAMAGCVGVAGSATIGPNCTMGGGAVVLGHLHLAEGVHISAATVVTKSITQPGHYTGIFPLADNASWERNAATLKQLHHLRDRIKTLEKANKP